MYGQAGLPPTLLLLLLPLLAARAAAPACCGRGRRAATPALALVPPLLGGVLLPLRRLGPGAQLPHLLGLLKGRGARARARGRYIRTLLPRGEGGAPAWPLYSQNVAAG